MLKYLFDLIAVLVVAVIVLIFAKKGFLKGIFRLAKWLYAFFFAYLLGGTVSNLLYEKFFYNSFLSAVTEKVTEMSQTIENFSGEKLLQSLPLFLQTDEVKEKLSSVQMGEGAVQTLSTSVAEPIARFVSNVVGYVATFLLSLLILWIVILILDKVVKISPVTSVINHVLGGILGGFLGFLLLVAAVSVVNYFFTNSVVAENSLLVRWLSGLPILSKDGIFNVGIKFIRGI